jgi:hypothetical protein
MKRDAERSHKGEWLLEEVGDQRVMMNVLRTHWHRISTGLLALALLGAGGAQLYQTLRGDCCYPGSPCCYPGSPCCHHAQGK